MTAIEKWNRIVDYYSKYFSAPEHSVQSVWESIFAELLGYSRLENEIERHRKIYIGSTERVITDIIIKDGSADLFVVELKQHNMPISKGMEAQLFSYLKQLRNDIGLLICSKIYVFDYSYDKGDDEQNKAEIEFVQNNPDGVKFVEMFSKNTFTKTAIREFIRGKIEISRNVSKISNEINSALLYKLLDDYFCAKYSEEECRKAFSGFEISIMPRTVKIGNQTPQKASYVKPENEENALSKIEAINICANNDIPVGSNCTLAKRSVARTYAANPSFKCLSQDWWIILNDYLKNELHILKVPANSITSSMLKTRRDKPSMFVLLIRCDDNNFVDTQSNISFAQWFIKTIKY